METVSIAGTDLASRTASRTPCIPWPGRLNRDGYGSITIHHRVLLAHRVVWESAFGPLPFGTVLRHDCDNRRCINLGHLRSGTHADNVADKVERDRQAKGEQNGRAVLAEDDVGTIRVAYAEGWPVVELARHFGVTHKTIRSVIDGRTWRASA